jgi:hAT family C-terminal dimerisation region
MQYNKFLIARSQQKNEKLFCYKVLLKVQKSSWSTGWWVYEWPELQKIATKLISMIMSSAAAEQNFFTMGFIHSKLCNSLIPKTVEKLVFIKGNLVPSSLLQFTKLAEYE